MAIPLDPQNLTATNEWVLSLFPDTSRRYSMRKVVTLPKGGNFDLNGSINDGPQNQSFGSVYWRVDPERRRGAHERRAEIQFYVFEGKLEWVNLKYVHGARSLYLDWENEPPETFAEFLKQGETLNRKYEADPTVARDVSNILNLDLFAIFAKSPMVKILGPLYEETVKRLFAAVEHEDVHTDTGDYEESRSKINEGMTREQFKELEVGDEFSYCNASYHWQVVSLGHNCIKASIVGTEGIVRFFGKDANDMTLVPPVEHEDVHTDTGTWGESSDSREFFFSLKVGDHFMYNFGHQAPEEYVVVPTKHEKLRSDMNRQGLSLSTGKNAIFWYNDPKIGPVGVEHEDVHTDTGSWEEAAIRPPHHPLPSDTNSLSNREFDALRPGDPVTVYEPLGGTFNEVTFLRHGENKTVGVVRFKNGGETTYHPHYFVGTAPVEHEDVHTDTGAWESLQRMAEEEEAGRLNEGYDPSLDPFGEVLEEALEEGRRSAHDYTVEIPPGEKRIDLSGIKVEDLPKVAEALRQAGFVKIRHDNGISGYILWTYKEYPFPDPGLKLTLRIAFKPWQATKTLTTFKDAPGHDFFSFDPSYERLPNGPLGIKYQEFGELVCGIEEVPAVYPLGRLPNRIRRLGRAGGEAVKNGYSEYLNVLSRFARVEDEDVHADTGNWEESRLKLKESVTTTFERIKGAFTEISKKFPAKTGEKMAGNYITPPGRRELTGKISILRDVPGSNRKSEGRITLFFDDYDYNSPAKIEKVGLTYYIDAAAGLSDANGKLEEMPPSFEELVRTLFIPPVVALFEKSPVYAPLKEAYEILYAGLFPPIEDEDIHTDTGNWEEGIEYDLPEGDMTIEEFNLLEPGDEFQYLVFDKDHQWTVDKVAKNVRHPDINLRNNSEVQAIRNRDRAEITFYPNEAGNMKRVTPPEHEDTHTDTGTWDEAVLRRLKENGETPSGHLTDDETEEILLRAENAGITFTWEPDYDADLSWMDKEQLEEVHEIEYCTAENERTGERTSLAGITDADDEYRRTVEAELAMELGIERPVHIEDEDIHTDTGNWEEAALRRIKEARESETLDYSSLSLSDLSPLRDALTEAEFDTSLTKALSGATVLTVQKDFTFVGRHLFFRLRFKLEDASPGYFSLYSYYTTANGTPKKFGKLECVPDAIPREYPIGAVPEPIGGSERILKESYRELLRIFSRFIPTEDEDTHTDTGNWEESLNTLSNTHRSVDLSGLEEADLQNAVDRAKESGVEANYNPQTGISYFEYPLPAQEKLSINFLTTANQVTIELRYGMRCKVEAVDIDKVPFDGEAAWGVFLERYYDDFYAQFEDVYKATYDKWIALLRPMEDEETHTDTGAWEESIEAERIDLSEICDHEEGYYRLAELLKDTGFKGVEVKEVPFGAAIDLTLRAYGETVYKETGKQFLLYFLLAPETLSIRPLYFDGKNRKEFITRFLDVKKVPREIPYKYIAPRMEDYGVEYDPGEAVPEFRRIFENFLEVLTSPVADEETHTDTGYYEAKRDYADLSSLTFDDFLDLLPKLKEITGEDPYTGGTGHPGQVLIYFTGKNLHLQFCLTFGRNAEPSAIGKSLIKFFVEVYRSEDGFAVSRATYLPARVPALFPLVKNMGNEYETFRSVYNAILVALMHPGVEHEDVHTDTGFEEAVETDRNLEEALAAFTGPEFDKARWVDVIGELRYELSDKLNIRLDADSAHARTVIGVTEGNSAISFNRGSTNGNMLVQIMLSVDLIAPSVYGANKPPGMSVHLYGDEIKTGADVPESIEQLLEFEDAYYLGGPNEGSRSLGRPEPGDKELILAALSKDPEYPALVKFYEEFVIRLFGTAVEHEDVHTDTGSWEESRLNENREVLVDDAAVNAAVEWARENFRGQLAFDHGPRRSLTFLLNASEDMYTTLKMKASASVRFLFGRLGNGEEYLGSIIVRYIRPRAYSGGPMEIGIVDIVEDYPIPMTWEELEDDILNKYKRTGETQFLKSIRRLKFFPRIREAFEGFIKVLFAPVEHEDVHTDTGTWEAKERERSLAELKEGLALMQNLSGEEGEETEPETFPVDSASVRLADYEFLRNLSEMASITLGAYKFYSYSNDHAPPHFHIVRGKGKSALKVELELDTWEFSNNYNWSNTDLNHILRIARENRDELHNFWRRVDPGHR
jgi:hypothetical protein